MATALASSLSSLSLTRLPSVASTGASSGTSSYSSRPACPLRVECSSRPQKKATAHHVKTRPKKHNPYDKNRMGPTVYPKMRKPPPIWGLDTSDLDVQVQDKAEASTDAPAPAS